MKVLYDYQIFSEQEFGGISRYFCALTAQMGNFHGVEAQIVAPLHVNRYLKEYGNTIAVGQYVRRLPKTGRFIKTLSGALFRPLASMMRPDIVHETYYSLRPTCGGKMPRALTVYDMIHERYPDSFAANDSMTSIKAYALRRADQIFCISENTRRDLLEFHRLPEELVTVTYLGYDALPLTEITVEDLVGSTPYLLYVGGRHGYKNFEGLLRAFAASSWLRDNLRLVCFGAAAFSRAELNLIASLGLSESQVIHRGGGDDRLATLYKGAAAFVYPSQYEGFGIPPLEAMSLDCPVICSNTSSIPEVVGEAGEYFDPLDIESIKVAIERVLQSPMRQAELVALGRSRREQFSWERCARETFDVYRRLAA
jgi:glycosyltransferase involved in cell wall biosynthesis